MRAFDNSIVIEDLQYLDSSFGSSFRFEGKRIVITGCAGFLGYYFSHYFAYLINRGVDIKGLTLLDSFLLGRPDWLNEIEALDGRINVHAFNIASDSMDMLGDSADADFVIHMASIASPVYYRKYPVETMDANIWGLRNLLERYRNSGLEGFLFFSSSEVYGDPHPDMIPTHEDYLGNVSTMGPRACYDEAKRFGETLCYVFNKSYGLPIRIVRPFNNYGPGMNINDKRVPADFAKAVIEGRDIVMFSDGTPTRTFCYITDAVAGYLKALVHESFDYFNIGIDKPEISIRNLADIYCEAGAKVSGYKGKAVFETPQESDYLVHNPSRRCPDISKAEKVLGYNPTIEVHEGIERFLFYLKQDGAWS